MRTTWPLLALVLAAFGCASSTREPPSSDPAPAASEPLPVESATPTAVATPPVASASASAEPPPFNDTLAGLAAGVAQDVLEKKLGKPKSKSPVTEEQATGEHVSSWTWADGVTAMMAATSAKGPFHVRLLMIAAPSKATTGRGIGIGSTREQVDAAYAKEIDAQVSNDEMVVVGEMHGGLRVHFDKQKRVRSLALGADGE